MQALKILTVATILLQKDAEHKLNGNRLSFDQVYDFIVVGSGSAGAIVAHRLAEDRRTTVLLLEAGGPPGVQNDIPISYVTLFNTEYDWNYTMERQFVGHAFHNERISENRGQVLGGCSSTNAMIFNRGNARDFDHWVNEYGAIGWSYREVLPYFMKYEKNIDPNILANGYHGSDGPVEITSWPNPDPIMRIHQRVLNGLGIQDTDINGPVQFGTALAQSTKSSRGVRSSTVNSYLDPNPFPDNLHIMTRSLVSKVLFNENKTAIGVEFFRNEKAFKVMAKKEVIVSGGTINSPQLLMLSGIGPKDHLAQFGIRVLVDLPVGDHLTNHPGMNVNFLIKNEYQDLARSGDPTLTIDSLHEYYLNDSGILPKYYNSFIYLSTEANKDPNWPNVAIEATPLRFPKSLDNFIVYRFGARRSQWEEYYRDFYGKNYIFSQALLEKVTSFGYLRLKSNNPFVYPIFNPRFLTTPQDFEDFVDITRFLFYFYERSDFSKYLEPHKPIPGCQFCPNKRYAYECDSYIKCHIIQMVYTGYHPVGTCRMGDPRRPDTVLDPKLRVKGVQRLRVCDASVMPIVTNGNTNAPTMMIGEKCADMIKEEHGL